MASHVGIVYSLAQRRRRMLLIPDFNGQLDEVEAKVTKGTAFIRMPMAAYKKMTSPHHVDAWLAARVGPASSDRCAVINAAGVVVACIQADPLVDNIEGHFLVQSDTLNKGDVYAVTV